MVWIGGVDSSLEWLCEPAYCWLLWPGWGGVGGVVAVIALAVAAGFGIHQVVKGVPVARGVAARVTRSPVVVDGRRGITLVVRPTGPQPMYELEVVLVAPDEDENLLVTRPVLEVRDDPIEVKFDVDASSLSDYRVIVEWLVPGRPPLPGGAKFGLADEMPFSWWHLYRWRRWPRRVSGRWKESKKAPSFHGGVDRSL